MPLVRWNVVSKCHRPSTTQQGDENALELFNAVHALRLLGGVHEAAEGSLELLAARAVGHPAQARAVPVDLAGLGVERGLLVGFVLEFLGRFQGRF